MTTTERSDNNIIYRQQPRQHHRNSKNNKKIKLAFAPKTNHSNSDQSSVACLMHVCYAG